MNLEGVLLCFCAACANAVVAFPFAAAQRGWKKGEMFSTTSAVPPMIALCITGPVLGSLIYGIFFANTLSWWWALLAVVSFLFGGMLIVALFRSLAGMVSPVLAAAAYVAHFFV